MKKLVENYADPIKDYPIAENEEQRQAEVEGYDILDTLPEEEFDSLVELAAIITGSPMSLMNILDKDRQWSKAAYGLKSGETIKRSETVCTYTIMTDHGLEIEDLKEDFRFKNNSYVEGDPFLRFYSGYPLKTSNGLVLGALCVLDTKPRELNDTQKKALTTLAKEIVARLEIRKTQLELERLNRQKDHFLRAINHDIKSPINGIIGSTNYLQTLWDGDQEELFNILSMIELSARKLVTYTSELVSNSVEQDEARLLVDEVLVDELISDLIHIYMPLAKAKNVTLVTKCITSGAFRLDNEKFKLIISNLISNALKFTQSGDRITVEAEIKEEEQRMLHCSVTDTGIGIPEEFIPNLFVKNKKHQRQGTQGEISTGMGLPIVRQYVDLHSGTVNVDTKEGKGSAFHLIIPEQE